MAKMITKKHINMTARPRLTKVMEKAVCYLLEGELAKNKRLDAGALTIIADHASYHEIIIDEASYMGEPEFFKSIRLNDMAMYALTDLLVEKQPKRKESTGRPVKYGLKAVIQARELQKEGHSIRKIAEIMGASTFTVQRLLK